MILSEFFQDVQIAYKGNLKVPESGSDKYTVYLALANRKLKEWATDPYTGWNSLYREEAIGTVSLSTRDYELEDEFIRPSDYAIISIDDATHEVPLIQPEQASTNSGAAYIHGNNPKVLTFTETVSDRYNGGSLILPAYYLPDALVNPTDTIVVDDPNWLVYAVASELARNDYSKDDQFGNLAGIANDLYQKMKEANDNNSYMQDNSIAYNMPEMGS